MSARRVRCCGALAALCFLAGCHHRAPVRATLPPPPPPANAGPVMVSVPPPTHRSMDASGEVATHSEIPVVKPVRPPRKPSRKQPATPPQVAAVTPPAPPVAAAPPPAAAVSLGELTASTADPSATRDGAAQAIRRERERLNAISGTAQAAHAAEIDQARRFLKSASDSWNAADYAAAVSLATKVRVLLDDLLK